MNEGRQYSTVTYLCACKVIQLFVTQWTIARQAPLSMKISRQEYLSTLPFSTPGDLLDPRTETASPLSPELACGFFTTLPPEKPVTYLTHVK